MPLVSIENLAANKWQSMMDTPRGFLHAFIFDLEPLTAEYKEMMETILANVLDDLTTMGISHESTQVRYKMVARQLLRYYGAEAVLAHADVGSYQDVEGSQYRLTASDLNHWQRMKDQAAEKLNDFIELEMPRTRSAVWLVSVSEKEGGDDAYKILKYG